MPIECSIRTGMIDEVVDKQWPCQQPVRAKRAV
jgi:hypothetical protein